MRGHVCIKLSVTATLSCLELLSCSAGAVWGFWAQQGADWLLILDGGSPRACWVCKTWSPITAGIKMLALAFGLQLDGVSPRTFTSALWNSNQDAKAFQHALSCCWYSTQLLYEGEATFALHLCLMWSQCKLTHRMEHFANVHLSICEIGTPSKITFKVMAQTFNTAQ